MVASIKLEVLEERLANFESLVARLDAAIEKIAEVNNNVGRMLTIHEERISKQEEIDAVLFDKIDKLRDKMDVDHNSVLSRIQSLDKKIWIAIGSISVITFVIAETPIMSMLTEPIPASIIRETD